MAVEDAGELSKIVVLLAKGPRLRRLGWSVNEEAAQVIVPEAK